MDTLRNLLADRSGATAIEYCLLAGLLAMGLAATFSQIGTTLQNSFGTAANSFGG